MKKLEILFLLAICFVGFHSAAQSTTQQNGDYSSNSTWVGNSPNPVNSDVLILHDVLLDEDLTIKQNFEIQGSLYGDTGSNIDVTTGGTLISGSIDIDGQLEIAGSGHFTVMSGDTVIVNDFLVKNTATVYVGAGGVIIVEGDFKVRNSSVLTIDGEIIVSGAFETSQSAIIQGNGSVTAGNSTNISNTSTVFGTTDECTSCIYSNGCVYNTPTIWNGSVSTDWFNAGNWTSGVPDLKTAATISSTASIMPVISGGGAACFTLLIEQGASLEIAATNSIDIWGDFNVEGTFIENKSTLNFIGDCWATEISSTSVLNIYNMKVANVNNVTIKSGQDNVYGEINISAGSLITNDSLVLISDANGSARIGEITGVGVSGKVSVERYVDAGETYWRYMGSAVQGATVAQFNDDFVTAGYPGSHFPNFGWISAYNYDEAAGVGAGYIECGGTTDVLNVGQGWQVWSGDTITGTEPFTFDFLGVPNQGDIDMPVTYTFSGLPTEDGWNLVSNPYASTIDWDAAAWTKTNMANAIYIQNPDNQQYATYVAGASVNGGSRYIASQQAFWVQAFAANPVLTAREGVKSNVDQAFLKSSAEQNPGLKITLQGVEEFDEAIIRHVDGAIDAFEYLVDAEKWYGGWGEYPQLSVMNNDSKDLTVHSFDNGNQELSIPIRAIVFENGVYHLNFDNLASVNAACMILEDLYSGETYLIEEGGSYPFEMSDTTYAPRFLLHVGKDYESTVTKATCKGEADGQIALDLGLDEFVDYQLISNGVTEDLNDFANPLIISDLESGIYTIEVATLSNVCNLTTFNFVVGEPSSLMIDAEVTEEMNGYDGEITVEVTGGTAPYNFYWENGSNASGINGLTSGAYNLQIEDDNGCELQTTIVVDSQLGLEDENSDFNMVYLQSINSVQIQNWSGEQEELYLFDLNGRKTGTYQLNSSSQIIPIQTVLSQGVYIFGNANHSIKILITN